MEFTENRFIQFHGRVHGSDLILVDPVRGPFYTIGQGITEAVARQLGAPAEANRQCVWVNPGVYTEALTMQPFVDVKAVGTPEQTIIRQVDGVIVTLASDCGLEGFIVRLVTPTLARNMIVEGGAPTARTGVNIRRCTFEITTPGGLAHRVMLLQAASNVTWDHCRWTITDGANPGIQAVRNDTAAATVTLLDCTGALNDTAGFHAFSSVAGTWILRRNDLSGTAGTYSVSLGTVSGFNNLFSTLAASAVTGGRVTEKAGWGTYDVFNGMVIGHALTAAAADTPTPAAATPYVIRVYPGLYVEALTLAAFVTVRGMGAPEDVIVRQADATIVTLSSNSKLERATIDLNAPSAARNMIVDGGVAATSCALNDLLFTITTPGAHNNRVVYPSAASQIVVRRCYTLEAGIGGTGSNEIVANDTVGATITLIDNVFVHNNANARHLLSSVAGTWRSINNTFRGTSRVTTTWTLGTYLGTGNRYRTTGNADQFTIAGGSFTEKNGPGSYQVYAGMVIGHAITAAAADTPAPAAVTPYDIFIHPGVYTEVVAPSAWINLRGSGAGATVLVQADASDVLTLNASNVQVSDLTVRVTTPSAARFPVRNSANGVTGVTLRRVTSEITTPGGFANVLFIFNIAATVVTLIDCRGTLTDAANPACLALALNNGAQVLLQGCYLEVNSTSATARVINIEDAGCLATIENCILRGTATHVRTGNATATARIRNSQYRSVLRSNGNIVDESVAPPLAAYRSLLRTHPTAAIANENIATRIAIGGAATPGGSGQVRLRINDNAADAAGTEQNADAAGALASTWTPARVPRYVMPFSINAFRATTTAFLGLRATLGAAVPGAAEHHAGFIWDGANFIASSSNGAGVGQTTALTTPSTGALHILEFMVLSSGVEFYVDGRLVATHANAAGIPTAALSFQEYEISNGAGAATQSDITLRTGMIVECPA